MIQLLNTEQKKKKKKTKKFIYYVDMVPIIYIIMLPCKSFVIKLVVVLAFSLFYFCFMFKDSHINL
jgi:flagellar biosynthesis component FlhA